MSSACDTFNYLKPTDDQMESMAEVRAKFQVFVEDIEALLPDGPWKTRRACVSCDRVWMWCNVAITRNPDGSPRGAELMPTS